MAGVNTMRKLGIGGDFPLAPACLVGGEGESLFSSGRDALAAIARCEHSQPAIWLVPEFICPVVPETLRSCGVEVRPYAWLNPWRVHPELLLRSLSQATAIVVPFYMGLPPVPDIWEILKEQSLQVVEDRCQCVGPAPLPAGLAGDYAIGSYRKWMAVPDGAYCVCRDGVPPRPSGAENQAMLRLRLAAALVKQARKDGVPDAWDPVLESIGRELFRLGELAVGIPLEGRRASHLTKQAVDSTSFGDISGRRIQNQRWLAERLVAQSSLKLWEPEAGALARANVPLLALPLLCSERDNLRKHLAAAGVFCAVHWQDADWSGSGGAPAAWASQTLSLPIDQRYEAADLARIVEVLA